MRRIKVWVDTGTMGSDKEEIIEVEDDATEEDIKKEAEECIYNMINSGWCEIDEDDNEVG